MRNYMVVLLRTLQREKLYAAINIAGLSLGIACCLILGMFLRSELTYDQHFDQHDRIYRIVNEIATGGSGQRFAITSGVLAPMLVADYPQIKAYVRFQSNAGGSNGVALHHGNDTFYWKNSYFVDDNIFEVFSHKILYGDPKTALKDQAALAVSATFAKKYFGNANPIGEIISTDSGIPSHIALVFEDLPPNTHLKYDVLFSNNLPFLRIPENSAQRRQALWGVNNFTYLLMAPGFDPKTWPRVSDEFFQRYMADIGKASNSTWHSWLQLLSSVHLESDLRFDLPNGNALYLYACAAVAVFILAVACINYMNLATARATRRARAVGIRKILGANRLSLALQFLGEAMLFALIALVVGLVIVEVVLTLTPINSLMEDQAQLDLLHQPTLAAGLIGLALFMGLLSGAYPALYLSSWAPLSALTGKHAASAGNLRLREALVLVQFTISAAVIACTLLMGAQMRYVANKSLGFEKEHRLVVTLRGDSTIGKLATIRSELTRNSHVLAVGEALIPIGGAPNVGEFSIENNDGVSRPLQLTDLPIGEDFVHVMGLKVLQGRDFSQRFLTDVGTNFLVNEALVRKMGWTEPLGKHIQRGSQAGRVIGVVRDFNFKSLHTLIEPLVMSALTDDMSDTPVLFRVFQQRLLVVNILGEDVGDTLGYIEKVMAQADPRHPFEYEFLDDTLDNLYRSESRLMKLIGIFAAVCIFIACLGLFGLATFTTEQRTHEIGTRKVLGATTWQIIAMLARRIMVLVIMAAVLASAISYFAIDKWLTGFAYRAGINPLIFVLSAAAAAAVAFATVALQSFKTANADPVKALRHV
jgi:putative ABC transport system permease protein